MIPIGDGPDSTPRRALRHAVVIGGGIAGLLAARVLSDHFERVTLLERHPDLGPQDLLDTISEQVLQHAGGVLRDDVALLALQARG